MMTNIGTWHQLCALVCVVDQLSLCTKNAWRSGFFIHSASLAKFVYTNTKLHNKLSPFLKYVGECRNNVKEKIHSKFWEENYLNMPHGQFWYTCTGIMCNRLWNKLMLSKSLLCHLKQIRLFVRPKFKGFKINQKFRNIKDNHQSSLLSP
jgi:hypothetical protein